ncbi:MAG TPA: zf-HC2 domain-containing protein [Gemmatimonadaceae bacterium]
MTDCSNAEIRDQLPDLLHGHLDDGARARVEAHIRACEECQREFDLLRRVRAAAPAPRVDTASIVGKLPTARRGRRWPADHVWQLAAAVVILAVGASTVATYVHRTDIVTDTSVAALGSSRGSNMDSSVANANDVELSVGYGYSELTDAQLQTLLKDVQHVNAVPLPDPDISIPNVSVGNGGV